MSVLCRGGPSEALRKLIREMFLDQKGRYLCYSSHWGMDVIGASDPSPRNRCTVAVARMSPITQEKVEKLRERWNNIPLVPVQVAYYGGLYGLMYSCLVGEPPFFNPLARFAEDLRQLPLGVRRPEELLPEFYKQVCDGTETDALGYYSRYTYRDHVGTQDDVAIWPLCYARAFLTHTREDVVQSLLGDVDNAYKLPQAEHDLEWEYRRRPPEVRGEVMDSVVAQFEQYDDYVVYENRQCYPELLLTYYSEQKLCGVCVC